MKIPCTLTALALNLPDRQVKRHIPVQKMVTMIHLDDSQGILRFPKVLPVSDHITH